MTAVVGYPGPEGSHTGAAAAVLAPDAAEAMSLPSFTAVVEAAAAATIELAVLPIESSLIGPIAETHDLLYDAPLSIVAETTLPIRHCLLAPPGATLESIALVRSHPAAFDQCRGLLASWRVRAVAAATTADAAHEVALAGDATQAAIASPEAAAAYGLDILRDDVGDADAFTRFVALARYTRLDREAGWRTALSFVTDHRPGALVRALGPFGAHDLNLVQLVSRPLPRSHFRYRFDVVLDGHVFDEDVRTALREVRSLTRRLRLFGSYPAAPGRLAAPTA